LAADPARAARLRADVARVRAGGRPTVLVVLHDRAGGTLRHVHELAAHLHGGASFFSLVPAPGGAVRLQWLEPGAAFHLEFVLPQQEPEFLQALRAIGVAHVHYHHVLGHQQAVLRLPAALGVAYDFTAHDYFT